jgi:hypothetical protein
VTSTYTAVVSREGRWWMVRVPAIDGLTQARRLAEAGQMARELIALERDVPIEDVRVDVAVGDIDGVDVAAEIAAIHRQRAQAEQLERDATARTRALARRLAAHDLALRDIGTILGVSHQRAHQLVS